MRVLLCERSFSGHRKSYFQRLSDMEGIEFYSFAPENTGLPLLIAQKCTNRSRIIFHG